MARCSPRCRTRSEVFAYFNVSEADYLEFIKTRAQDSARSTNMVRLVLADGSLYSPPGKIETVESEFESNTGAIAFRARFANPEAPAQARRHRQGAPGQHRGRCRAGAAESGV